MDDLAVEVVCELRSIGEMSLGIVYSRILENQMLLCLLRFKVEASPHSV